MIAPLRRMNELRVNQTLHGRSVYRCKDVPGHNVLMGWTEWLVNGHHGIGDGLDLFCKGGTEVVAPFDGVVSRWLHDAERLETIYIVRSDGATAVLAHINYKQEKLNLHVKAGEVVAYVRKDLNDPHLHLELRLPGQMHSLAATTPLRLQKKWSQLCGIV